MKNIIILIVILGLAANVVAADRPWHTLTLRWNPALSSADPSCGVTDAELQKAVRTLTKSLKKTGMSVQLGQVSGGPANAASGVGLWINNVPFEQWLSAEIVTPASSAERDCPVIRVGDETYETIPADLIVKAGLAAAGDPLSLRAKD